MIAIIFWGVGDRAAAQDRTDIELVLHHATAAAITEELPPDRVAQVAPERIEKPKSRTEFDLLAWSLSRRYAIVGNSDGVLRYNWQQRRFDAQLSLPWEVRPAISFDGTRLANIDFETSKVQVLDLNSGSVLYTTSPLPFAPDRSVEISLWFSGVHDIVTVRDDRHWHHVTDATYDAANATPWSPSEQWHTIESEVLSLPPDFRHLVTRNDSNQIEVLFPHTSMPVVSTMTFDNAILSARMSIDEDRLLVGERRVNDDTGESADVWHVLETESLIPLGEPWVAPDDWEYNGAAWLEGQPVVIYLDERGSVTLFDVHGRSVLSTNAAFHLGNAVVAPKESAAALNGILVRALASADSRRSKKDSLLPRLVPQIHAALTGVDISQDGRIVATNGADGWISLWDRTSRRMFRRVPYVRTMSGGRSVALSPDGERVMGFDNEGVTAWDVPSGESLHSIALAPGDSLLSFVAGGARAMMCSFGRCMLTDVPIGSDTGTINSNSDAILYMPMAALEMSLGTDESSVAMLLSDELVYHFAWMQLSSDGDPRYRVGSFRDRQGGFLRTIKVVALDDARVAVGLSNGMVLMVDVERGEILHSLDTREHLATPYGRQHPNPGFYYIRSIIPLGADRIAVGGNGGLLVVSVKDLTVLQRVSTPILPLTSDSDGRWLISGVQGGLEVWDVAAMQPVGVLRTDSLVGVRVEFDRYGELFLVDGATTASLWSTKSGFVRQFRHHDHRLAMLGEGAVFYVPPAKGAQEVQHVLWDDDALFHGRVPAPDDLLPKAIRSWTSRLGERDVLVQNGLISDLESLGNASANADGSCIVGSVIRPYTSVDGKTLWNYDDRAVALVSLCPDNMEAGLRLDFPGRLERFRWAGLGHRILLDRGDHGLELLDASNGESIWSREDVTDIDDMWMSTGDDPSVVVTTYSDEFLDAWNERLVDMDELYGDRPPRYEWTEQEWSDPDARLMVLDATDGYTRFVLQNGVSYPGLAAQFDELGSRLGSRELAIVPVVNGTEVEGLLRLVGDGRIELLSLRDGSVMDSANVGLWSLKFAASSRDGGLYVVADHDGNAVLWDTKSRERAEFEITANGAEGLAFSPDGRLMAIADTDGTVGLWDVSKGPAGLRHLAKLIAFEDGDWAVVGADGRYDASDPADLDGLNWVLPDAPTKPVPLSVFYRDYYEPGLLTRLLRGEEFSPIESISNRDRTQPQVQITDVDHGEDGHVNVTVEVRRSGARGVDDLKLFRDGRLVELKEDLGRVAVNSPDTWRVTFPDIALPTSGVEAVEFSAYAFNADGIKSETHRFRFDDLPEVEARPRRAFVIVVGVNAYQNPKWDLHYAAEDARAVGDIVTKHLEASGAFDEVRTVSLIAERDTSGEMAGTATRADVLGVLDVLAGKAVDSHFLSAIGAEKLTKATPDDLVYFAFSGHGLSDNEGRFHLFLSDIDDGGERVVDRALLKSTLDSDMLTDHLRDVDAGDFVMVIDACNAAASVQGGGFKPGPMGSRGLGQLAYDKAMRVLAASQAEAVALESDRLRHGLLTYAMLREGLAGGAADRAPEDRWIDLTEMLNYGVERVPLLYEDIRDGSFATQGKGLTPYEPSCGNEQGGDASDCREQSVASVQRPSLFDFSRGEQDVCMPVVPAEPPRADGADAPPSTCRAKLSLRTAR